MIHTPQSDGDARPNAKTTAEMERLMMAVYGDWAEKKSSSAAAVAPSAAFPKPLPRGEAGEGRNKQRRYLWTDAFGLLNFVTLAHRAAENDDSTKREGYVSAGRRLIASVHSTLGQPVDPNLYPMAKDKDGATIGLRIGKVVNARKSDAGMEKDGMYWHYFDKWLFALHRFGQFTNDTKYTTQARQLAAKAHPYFVVPGKGVRWKINVDASPIPDLEPPGPSSDAVSALLTYSLMALPDDDDRMAKDVRGPARDYLHYAASRYHRLDPLSFGLQAWEAQWMPPQVRERILAQLKACSSESLDVRSGMGLPFRLYGGLMGAILLRNEEGFKESAKSAARVARELGLEYEHNVPTGSSDHSAINKVMLAAALDPWAWERRAFERDLSV